MSRADYHARLKSFELTIASGVRTSRPGCDRIGDEEGSDLSAADDRNARMRRRATPPAVVLDGSCIGEEAGQAYNQQARQKLGVSFLIDKSIMPRSGNTAANYPYRYAAAWVRVTNLGGNPPQPVSHCDSGGTFGTPDTTGRDLGDGNALIHEPVTNDELLLAGGNSATFDIGHQEWRVARSTGLGRSDVTSGVRVGIDCLLACSQDITVSVSPR